MLETEEVDDDYFTPVSNTSLANIFNATKKETDKNNPLKYEPQIPSPVSKTDETKSTECVFACAVTGYEWYENVYTPRGNIGLAILKTIKTGYYTIVLYDSSKITLSCATISQTLELTLKGKTYISYFDDLKKYWSLYAKENQVSHIINILKSHNVAIKNSEAQTPESLEAQSNEKNEPNKLCSKKEDQADEEIDSDIDSSLSNKKNKASILSRMASMGQAILPINPTLSEKTSDSSDDNSKTQHVHRHKPVIKSVLKKSFVDRLHASKNTHNQNQGALVHHTEIASENFSHLACINSNLIPTSSNFLTNSNNGNDFNMLMSEQRINNSELRINMNRISDKVDQILDKVKENDTVSDNHSVNIQVGIMQKLLSEYEHKIHVYENIIKAKGIDIGLFYGSHNTSYTMDELNNCKESLEKTITEKDKKINKLLEQVEHLNREVESHRQSESDLTRENSELKSELESKAEEFNELLKNRNSETSKISESNTEVVDRVKKIMNDCYQTISANFNDDENFTGEVVKIVIAKVIKQITMNSMKEVT